MSPSGKRRKSSCSRGGGEQEIALVALGIAGAIERAAAARQADGSHVVPGRQHARAEIARGREQVLELDRLVAVDARHRRLARDIARGERIDHRLLEAALVVEHVVRNADPLGDRAGVVDVLPGAAGALAVGRLAMVVELERDADDVIALGLQQRRRHRGIDAARHRDDHARVLGPSLKIERIQHPGPRPSRAPSKSSAGGRLSPRTLIIGIPARHRIGGPRMAGSSCRRPAGRAGHSLHPGRRLLMTSSLKFGNFSRSGHGPGIAPLTATEFVSRGAPVPHVASKASVLQSATSTALTQRERMGEPKDPTSPFSILLAEAGGEAPPRAQRQADQRRIGRPNGPSRRAATCTAPTPSVRSERTNEPVRPMPRRRLAATQTSATEQDRRRGRKAIRDRRRRPGRR